MSYIWKACMPDADCEGMYIKIGKMLLVCWLGKVAAIANAYLCLMQQPAHLHRADSGDGRWPCAGELAAHSHRIGVAARFIQGGRRTILLAFCFYSLPPSFALALPSLT
ncbi:hypothetical protein [Hymenobacter cavernae]|uniref:Uncharacterized protein n=1 Tax=Hymenobacter cavernae TaxID=2044852 RepID=A0ABQ1UVP9_9BACT|nr:hypothetical protein [Hymenobacter cavernae]GGF28269.1 hypothetical protein GCM10011383_45020 [Hymenobacter cavernae]